MRICCSHKIKRIAHWAFQCYTKQKINLAGPRYDNFIGQKNAFSYMNQVTGLGWIRWPFPTTFYIKIWRVFQENIITTWKIKFPASILKLCAPNELAQVTVIEATKMKWKASIRLRTQKWCNCEKYQKMLTTLKCTCCHEILKIKAFHLMLEYSCSGIFYNIWGK